MSRSALARRAPPAPASTRHGPRAFEDLRREHGFRRLHVEGRVPEDLRGTLYRNGPGLFSAQGRPYEHWFDGDGAVSAVRFGPDGVRGAVRLVQSAGLRQERRAGRPLYATYGTPAPGPWYQRLAAGGPKNVANTSVTVWNGRLLALMEAGRPTELCPEQLFTLGETDLGGVVGGMFSAHPHRVPARRASYNFGMRIVGGTGLDLYELPDHGPARRMGFVPLEELSLVHDFIATENHLVFFLPPVRLRLLKLMAVGCFSDSLAWRPEQGTEVVVVPIDAPERVLRFTVEPFHVWHFANAFEEGGTLHVDYVRLPDFSSNELFRDLPKGVCRKAWDGRYHRAEIDLSRRTFRSRVRSDVPCDFPQLAPAALGVRQRFTYLGGWSESGALGPPDSVVKLEPETGKATRVYLGEGQIPSEPAFVPRASATREDDGYLLTLVYDGPSHTSHVAVLDARVPEAGPLARVHFDQHIPLTFHGSFVPARA